VDYLETAIDLCRAAGEILNYYADREKLVEFKGQANLVTIADKKSEELIIGGILSRWGVAVPFMFAAGLCFANALLLYFTLPETVTPDHPARVSAARGRGLGQLIESLKNPRLGFVFVIYFLFVVAFSIMTTS